MSSETEEAELRRLDHARDVHGLELLDCPCAGASSSCKVCRGEGIYFKLARPQRCADPACPIGNPQ